jgi:hypothetical protein
MNPPMNVKFFHLFFSFFHSFSLQKEMNEEGESNGDIVVEKNGP